MNLCSKCIRDMGYKVRYPYMLKKQKGCNNCGSDQSSINKKDIEEQIRIVGDLK